MDGDLLAMNEHQHALHLHDDLMPAGYASRHVRAYTSPILDGLADKEAFSSSSICMILKEEECLL